MNFHLRSDRKRKSAMPRLLAVFLFVVLVWAIQYFAPSFFFGISSAVLRPLWSGQNALSRGILTLDSYLSSKKGLEEEVTRLNAQILENQADSHRLVLLEAENMSLKQALERTPEIKKKLAAILRKPPLSPYDSFVIDVGSEGGAKVGQRILAQGDVLVGEIIETAADASKVRLYSSQGVEFPVNVGTSSVQLVAVGKGGGGFEIEALRDMPIAIGDAVSIPGVSTILFGTVEAVDVDPVEPFKRVFFRSPVNVFELPWVQIEISEK
jgi:cell shape-determining protein MreC